MVGRNGERKDKDLERGGLRCRGFYALGAAIHRALSVRLARRFPKYFGGGSGAVDKPKLLENQIAEQKQFWMKLLTTVAKETGTSITELRLFDVFEFFSLLSVVDEKLNKK